MPLSYEEQAERCRKAQRVRSEEQWAETEAKMPFDRVVEALEATRGGIHATARMLGISPTTLKAHMTEEMWQARAEIRDLHLDRVEAKLAEAAEKGEPWAVCFTLKCHAKHRGYIERDRILIADKKGKYDELYEALRNDATPSGTG